MGGFAHMIRRRKSFQLKVTFCCVLLCVLLAAFGCASLRYFYSVKSELHNQMVKELSDTTKLSGAFLDNFFSNISNKLSAVATMCDVPDGSGNENWWPVVEEHNTENYRMGVADAAGQLYYGPGRSIDISDTSYFEQTMSGNRSISDVQKGNFRGGDSVIVSIPILREGAARGCVCLEYSTMAVGELINTAETKGIGATMAVDADGCLIASFPGMEEFETLYDMLEGKQLTEGTVEELRQTIAGGAAGLRTYYGEGGFKDYIRFLYYQPAGINDWSIVTVVNGQQYQTSLQNIQKDAYLLVGAALLFSLGTALLFVYLLFLRRKEAEQRQRAGLTRVYTRSAAQKIVEKDLKRGGAFTCCMFIDIDRFKEINDTLGHDAGDRILVETAERLVSGARRHDIVSRYGGDEFNLWVADVTDPDKLRGMADNIVQTFRENGEITVSIGLTLFQSGGDTVEAILKRADQALYDAKNRGRDRYSVYEGDSR